MHKIELPKDKFFEKVSAQGFALTFDDVRLKTGYSSVMPDDVSLESKFSRNIPLKIPIVSAAMDTVTEHKLAIEIAKLGGLGIIHKNLTPEEQSFEVSKVKFYLNGLINKPKFVHEDDTVESIINRIKDKKYKFRSFLVLNNDKKLVGLLTGNDFEFCDNYNLKASEIMTTELITAKVGTTLDEAYEIMKKEKKKMLPLVNNEGRLCGLYVFSDLKRIKSGTSPMYNVDKNGQLRVGAAVGVGDDAFARLEKLVSQGVDVVVIDTAHGDSKLVIETLKEIKKQYSSIDVVVGNISESESAKRLIDAGADGIKIGQGPGSICTTRIIAGIGSPQVTAVYNCSKIADKTGVPDCADGGIRYPGDVPIAIGAGAHSVMMGGVIAGTDESPGETIFFKGRQWKEYRGMGSLGAMEKNKGSRERYNQKETGKSELIPEGVEGLVPYKGKLSDVIFNFVGGLKRGMGYVGARSIDELREKADFHMITASGQKESHPHDLEVIKEAPNYAPPTKREE